MKTKNEEEPENQIISEPAAGKKNESGKTKLDNDDFFIAGIGGSAGALDSLEQFFYNLPTSTGIGFIVVLHLDPTHNDILPELLQRFTTMPVVQAKDTVKVNPDAVYVIPPHKEISISHGHLILQPPSSPHGQRMPIDILFRSLAEDRKEKTIGIILSGMGTDGTLGVKALKEKCGIVMVQNPESAQFDNMPKSAIATGLADIIAAPGHLPEKLIEHVKYSTGVSTSSITENETSINSLSNILMLLKNQTNLDFSFYKKNTIYRRIERRMTMHQIDTISKYLYHLQTDPSEIEMLFNELLIGVTNFFRDPEAFSVLKEKAFPIIFNTQKPTKTTIRVWTVGCSTGEETYSLAILLREYLQETKLENDFTIQIFATDIDKAAVDRARQGLYPLNISTHITPERLQNFFIKEESNYRVRKEIREMIIFAPQNVINDPPFTKIDLLTCRNLLIYLTHEIQKKIIPLFHYALNPSGLLFLGTSETIGSLSDLFTTIDNKWKVYIRKESLQSGKMIIDLPVLAGLPQKKMLSRKATIMRGKKIPAIATEKLIEEFVPPVVFINEQGEILFISGRTGKYLEPAVGAASLNAFTMAREGLRFEMTRAVCKAVSHKKEVIVKGLKVRTNGAFQTIDLIVKPFTRPEVLQGVLMVVFEDVPSFKNERRMEIKRLPSVKHKTIVDELEQELKYTKEHLQITVEEMETSQEELRSTNEELQSANEELTTSKEELQSLNEELITVNAELQNKVDELSRANNDMKNLFNSTEIATIFLDNDMNIKRFTAPVTKIINLITSDVGRPISHIAFNLKYTTLINDIRMVLESLVFKEIQVETNEGSWYLMRIIPYRTYENVIEGVVITFTDISDFKRLEYTLNEAESRLRDFEQKSER